VAKVRIEIPAQDLASPNMGEILPQIENY